MCRMIADTELLFDESGYAATGPDSTAKAEGFSALSQQADELSALVYAEQRCGARSRVVMQSLHPIQRGSLQPLADRSLSYAQGLCNLLLCPSHLVQFPSAATPTFPPTDGVGVVAICCAHDAIALQIPAHHY